MKGGEKLKKKIRKLRHAPYLKLQAEIKLKGHRQNDIAELLKVSPSTLSQKISGILDFRGAEINKMCIFLDCSADVFLTN